LRRKKFLAVSGDDLLADVLEFGEDVPFVLEEDELPPTVDVPTSHAECVAAKHVSLEHAVENGNPFSSVNQNGEHVRCCLCSQNPVFPKEPRIGLLL
jgi:hypothetical protein